MKVGDLVRIDLPRTPFHGQVGLIVSIDKSFSRWPNNQIYYNVLTSDGRTVPFRYEQLIFSTDGYFDNDSYFSSR